MAPLRQPIESRLMRTMVERNGCWVWTGAKNRDGYGVLGVGRKQYRAHRVSYMTFCGPIPEGRLVCHKCDTPPCINPDHLFLGTPRDNSQDMVAKGRKHVVRGASHPSIKILPEHHASIREMRAGGRTLKDIAGEYGVTFQTISAICLGVRNYGSR